MMKANIKITGIETPLNMPELAYEVQRLLLVVADNYGDPDVEITVENPDTCKP